MSDMGKKKEKRLNSIGLLVDTAENFMALNEVNFLVTMKADALLDGIESLRDSLRILYEQEGGNCEETWSLGPYKRKE